MRAGSQAHTGDSQQPNRNQKPGVYRESVGFPSKRSHLPLHNPLAQGTGFLGREGPFGEAMALDPTAPPREDAGSPSGCGTRAGKDGRLATGRQTGLLVPKSVLVMIPQRNRTESLIQRFIIGIGSAGWQAEVPPSAACRLETHKSQWCNSVRVQRPQNQEFQCPRAEEGHFSSRRESSPFLCLLFHLGPNGLANGAHGKGVVV